MNEDFVSYEQAVKLRECGFDWKCREYYTPNKDLGSTTEADDFNSLGSFIKGEWFSDCISAPTLWQAQKWLREVHHISIRVNYIADERRWFADWLNLGSGEYDDTDTTFDTYEEALEDGITAALELIEKKGE